MKLLGITIGAKRPGKAPKARDLTAKQLQNSLFILGLKQMTQDFQESPDLLVGESEFLP